MWTFVLLAAATLGIWRLCAQEAPTPWWRHAVIYEIYPRSFQDTNGDGVGDLNGITARLDYLRDLGIDAIWITPVYPSPQVDFGYDISDYKTIDPQYGTMEDFDRLVREARKRSIRVIMDFVANHTSDQNPWFISSRSSRDNLKRDWYIWRDGKAPGQPPNNWLSWFGHSAWTLDPTTNQYYYHYFYVQQPDLNWRNPAVREAMYDVLRFWLDRGVAGFRIDAVSRLFEDPALHDDPILPGTNAYGDPNIEHKYTDNLPEVHDVLREMRQVVDKYPGNPVLISEAFEPNVAELTRMYGQHGDEVQLPMDFQVADVDKLSAPEFRKLLDEIESNPAGGQPYFFFSNHDQVRQWDRYGDGVHNDQIAKLMATLLLTARGTPQMYYGEEIGMQTTPPKRKEDVKDPIGKTGWPQEKGRDGERTPMQWDGSANAGFTKGTPWLPVPPSAATINVEAAKADPKSLLAWYKSLIRLKKTNPAFANGANLMLDTENTKVLSWMRQAPGAAEAVVAVNFTAEPQTVNLAASGAGLQAAHLKTLLKTPGGPVPRSLAAIKLGAYGVYIGEVQ